MNRELNALTAGTWIADHSFHWAGKDVHRKKGEKVGNIMESWRKLREEEPAVLGTLKVWQSPTAYVDSIVYSWQQEEEASKFEPLLRLVDSLSTHWTEQAQHRNWLLQTVQASVPAGLTPVAQVTDTAFAQPAKAAARSTHDKQKRLFMLKARQEGVSASFRYGVREIAQVAWSMHKKMVAMNAERNTVLSESRACGWLHYRPAGGELKRAGDQKWAESLTEGTHKTTPQMRGRREEGVSEAGKPILDMLKQDLEPKAYEKCYYDEEDLVLHGQPSVLDHVEQRRLEAALLHPSVRKEVEEELASLALVTSQVPARRKVKEGTPKKTKASRKEKADTWREGLGSKTIASRLAHLHPFSKMVRKKVKKQLLKMKAGKHKKSTKKKVKAGEPLPLEAPVEVDPDAEAAQAAFLAEWHGKTVRILDRAATLLWRSSVAVVLEAQHSSQELKVAMKGAPTVQHSFLACNVTQLTGSEKPGFVVSTDGTKITLEEKESGVNQSIGEPKYLSHGQQAEDPELACFFSTLLHSSKKAGDPEAVRKTAVWMNAGTSAVVAWETSQAPHSVVLQEALMGWQEQLEASKTGESHLVLVPVAAAGHWTLLAFIRKGAAGAYAVKYLDSLAGGSAGCRVQAEIIGNHVWRLLHSATSQEDSFTMPETSIAVRQFDLWSCGLHVCNRAEELFREHRGEGRVILEREIGETRHLINKWINVLLLHKKAKEVKEAAQKDHGSEKPGSCLPPPPLPLPDSLTPKAALPSGKWGCSKCKWSPAGCLKCNPDKMLKHANKMLAAKASEKAEEAKAPGLCVD